MNAKKAKRARQSLRIAIAHAVPPYWAALVLSSAGLTAKQQRSAVKVVTRGVR